MAVLVLAEKPSVSQAIAAALGVKGKKDGYIEGNGYIISWCVGHLVGLANADNYEARYSRWAREDLPILNNGYFLSHLFQLSNRRRPGGRTDLPSGLPGGRVQEAV